ncbi:two-component regulator propeller domain-containing protein [uncultured Sunxiuqinia sp.]|uniref:hybrid sensor histidine kinase/response regulator transcription factor n=1 Tax=uncultured Sunxiuqinia sp. TaxID=1573825 RepID=UPI002AA87F86|nr:two-component regulator propeller domain-containing protein [uncultured Sunxiuqinia sp.]
MKYLVCIFFLFLLFDRSFSQSELSFENLSIEDGLANNSVRTMFQDQQGFMWFGTLNGLSRYDGQKFKTFNYAPNDSTSISNNKVRDIFQDGAGYIWVSTYDENAHRFDPKTEKFVNFPLAFSDQLKTLEVHSIYESSPGVVWFSFNSGGCARVISKTDSEEFKLDFFNSDNGLISSDVNFIRKGRNGGVWFGTSAGLCYLSDDRSEQDTSSDFRYFLSEPSRSITAMYESDESIWVGCASGELFKINENHQEQVWKTPLRGTRRSDITFIEESKFGYLCIGSLKGLVLINKTTGELFHYTNRNSRLVTEYISSCYQDVNGDFWLVTSRRGVTRFQVREKRFTQYPLRPELRQSILEGEKQLFYEDVNGNLWVGIYGGGVSRFNRDTETFEQYLHDDENPESLSSNLVLSLAGDQSGNIWIGTYKRGANKANLRKTNFHSLQLDNSTKKDFSNEVRAIFEDSRNWIWTGDKRGDIVVYDQNFNQLFVLNDMLEDISISSGVYAFEEDYKRQIWIATKGSGIYVIRNLPERASSIQPGKLEISRLVSDSDNPASLAYNDVFDLHEDRNRQMWVALYHGGVNVIKNPLLPSQKILSYKHNEDDRFSISDDRVRCFWEDRDGNIWIGTASGLNFLSSEYRQTDDKKYITIERSDAEGGLSHNDIICITEDYKNRLWVGTYGGGVNRYVGTNDRDEFYFETFQQADGLSSNLVLSIVEDGDQTLWIGTDFGLNKYNPKMGSVDNYYIADGLTENSFSEGEALKTSTGKLMFGHISGMIWFSPDSIKKSYRQVPIVLTDFKINGKTNQKKLNRARSFVGNSAQAIHLNYDENFLTFEFAALDYKAPSKIQYKFKLEEYEQNWNNSGNLNTAIYRELEPGDYQFRLQASNSDGLWVNPEMKLAITITPPPWETVWAYLFYTLIITGILFLLRRFTLERIKLKHEVEFEKQIADDKLKFYTSISHEFKTPLALILGPVEDMLANAKLPAEMFSSLKMVKRNTRRLLELIDQLMDFRKIQKGFFKLNKINGDPVDFLSEIYQAFLPFSKKQNIHFSFVHDKKSLRAHLDYKALEKIVFNLLSNAFKHTESGRSIRLELSSNEMNGELTIAVIDEGEGIRETDLPHIFDRFNLGDRSKWKDESSTGIGLSLCRELVDLLGGEIFVESKRGEGSSFKIRFVGVLVLGDDINEVQPTYKEPSYTRQYIDTIKDDESGDDLISKTPKTDKRDQVLIVEDNPDLQKFLVEHLSQNYNVLQAYDGKEGVKLARKENPDLIICDVMMPEMDGLELTRIMKSEFYTSHIPIILLTAKSLEEHKIEGIEIGADDYITKPFNMVYLEKRVQNILKQRKQLKERFGKDTNIKTKELTSSKADQEFMDKVIRLVEENMTNSEFSVDKMLPEFGFGRTVFYKKMKGISGYSPKDFVRIVRMKKAAELLCSGGITVSEVAFDVGYSDPEYFSRMFKKHFGKTPSEYQKQNR